MYSRIRPHAFLALRLPSDAVKVVRLVPHTTISIGKYGAFPANLLVGRPYNVTFEIVDRREGQAHVGLRVVPASELNADVLSEAQGQQGHGYENSDGVEYELVGEDGEVVVRSNRGTVDDPSRQKMSMEEIEALKREGTGAGKDLIARLLLSHSALEQKTSFALAKYTLRKTRKYLRRFVVLPLDVATLAGYLTTEKVPGKIMELREETLALIGSWANAHYGETEAVDGIGGGRWLVVDETGGLVVAALAERMGILYSDEEEREADRQPHPMHSAASPLPPEGAHGENTPEPVSPPPTYGPPPRRSHHDDATSAMAATRNTLTLIHANAQPNLALLKYFDFDPSNPIPTHPLHSTLKTLSWLQLLSPADDASYAEPDVVPDETLRTWKASKRGTYHRKRRRWQRVRRVVDEARAGGFDGLVVASNMAPAAILAHAVPLLRGGAPVVVYSPNVEPLAELADLYSTGRRTAFLSRPPQLVSRGAAEDEDFPLDPTLLLAPTLQTARLRPWQCLPGRTHPLMTGRGGAEGYLFTATRVLPAEGPVAARGKYKRRRVGGAGAEVKGVVDAEVEVNKQTEAKVEGDVEVGE